MCSTGDEFEEDDEHVERVQDTQDLPESEREEDRKDVLSSGDDQSSVSGDERDGRFHGPDSSWRFYTQEERALAASLEQAENNNLSIHLYNAHKWKEQLRLKNHHDHEKLWRNKLSWIERNEQGKLPFLPDSTWTAWPLRPSDVPRSNESWGVTARDPVIDADTYRRMAPWRPSLDLHESVKAEIMRQAKQRFEERKWSDEGADFSLSSQDLEGESKEDLFAQTPSSEEGHNESGQSAAALSSDAKPSFLVDEDAAHSLTNLASRHITAEIQSLLTGLHLSRSGHRSAQSRSQSRSRRQTSASQSRPGSSAQMESKKTRAEDEKIDNFDEQMEDQTPAQDASVDDEPNRARSSKRTARRHRLGTRDWSEVLGIAALTGWNQAVLDRAARRCAALLGEGMDIRALPGPMTEPSQSDLIRYIPGMLWPAATSSPVAAASFGGDSGNVVSGVGLGKLSCPHKSCPRHEEPYEKRWRLREHLKRIHHHSDAEVIGLLQRR